MDTVRFGRALGFGARSAAKTLIQAIDAATAEGPSRGRGRPAAIGCPPPLKRGAELPDHIAGSAPSSYAESDATPPPHRRGGLLLGLRRFRDSALKPFVRLSGVLLLEIAGVFFGIFALYGFSTMWRARTAWHAGSAHHREMVGGAVMLGIFGYFCVTSFLRAHRREHSR